MKKRPIKEKKLREELWEKTGWGKVATWYQNTLSSDRSTQKDLILPELLRFLPLETVKEKKILDLGCGTGFFLKEYILGGAGKSLGIDLDKELVELAESNLREDVKSGKVAFMQGDATRISTVGNESFDIVMAIESIPNMKNLKDLANEVFRVLEKGGKFVCVVNHPAFRVPKSSDWYFDKEKLMQGRVVYKYKSAHSIQIDMNPGTKEKSKKIYTYTFHRPFEEYLNTFTKAGLTFSFMKEISSNKSSQKGPRQKQEDDARREIPMFLFLEFKK
jgi:ubiquinone/menaquinone biosynthesis C-methylase UbiE